MLKKTGGWNRYLSEMRTVSIAVTIETKCFRSRVITPAHLDQIYTNTTRPTPYLHMVHWEMYLAFVTNSVSVPPINSTFHRQKPVFVLQRSMTKMSQITGPFLATRSFWKKAASS
jgi:hypothetical protein